MATVFEFEKLEVWMDSRRLYLKITALSKQMRENRDFRFAEQIKSSAGSIMDNIAEGFERNSQLEFIQALSYAKGESGELKSQLYRAWDDQYLTKEEFSELYEAADKVSRKIANFVKYLNQTHHRGLKFKNRIT